MGGQARPHPLIYTLTECLRSSQNGNAFDGIGLREQVEWRDLDQPVASSNQPGRVASQRGWVTRNVSDACRMQGQQRIQGAFFQAGARWIHDDNIGADIQAGQHLSAGAS